MPKSFSPLGSRPTKGRRLGVDRRTSSYTRHLPERRKQKNERRKNITDKYTCESPFARPQHAHAA